MHSRRIAPHVLIATVALQAALAVPGYAHRVSNRKEHRFVTGLKSASSIATTAGTTVAGFLAGDAVGQLYAHIDKWWTQSTTVIPTKMGYLEAKALSILHPDFMKQWMWANDPSAQFFWDKLPAEMFGTIAGLSLGVLYGPKIAEKVGKVFHRRHGNTDATGSDVKSNNGK